MHHAKAAVPSPQPPQEPADVGDEQRSPRHVLLRPLAAVQHPVRPHPEPRAQVVQRRHLVPAPRREPVRPGHAHEAAGAARPGQLQQHRLGIANVLQHVRRDHSVERPIGERQPFGQAKNERRSRDLASPVIGDVQRHDPQGARGQDLRERPGPRPRVQDPRPGPNHAEARQHVGQRSGGGPVEGRRVAAETEREAQDAPRAPDAERGGGRSGVAVSPHTAIDDTDR